MKFLNSTELVAEFALTTPMFLGDADQQTDTQLLRNASLKGALRFWWRALQWGPLRATCADDKAALIALHQQEAALFGSASNEQSQQSLFTINTQLKTSPAAPVLIKGAEYAYCIGLLDLTGSKLKRSGIGGGSLTVTLTFKPHTTAEQIAQIKQSLLALGFLGGLGSRSRKGLGSLSLQEIKTHDQHERYDSCLAIENFVKSLDCSAPALAPLSAFSRSTRIDISQTGKTPAELLQQVATVQKQSRKDTAKNNKNVFGSAEPRRSPAVFIHIHKFPDGKCATISTLLATEFLPNKSTDYNALHSFLNRFESRKVLLNG